MLNLTPRALLQTRSLRFWIMAGMLLALTPVVGAAVGGFILLNHGVIASFQDVADRQHAEILPAQRLGLMMWDTAIAVDEFVGDGNVSRQASYRSAETAIDAGFAQLLSRVELDPVASALAVSAAQNWKTAEGLGGELISVPRPAGDPKSVESMERFDGAIRAASDKLQGLIEQLEDDIDRDRDNADRTYERALWLAGIAAGVCLITIVFGVMLIGRVMSASVDRLVDGALRFAEGDRAHRIEVRIPPELRRVADEFNRMITKIHAYEDILAQRALRDVLTGLPNRRAFEESMARSWERKTQFAEPFAVLVIDIDHFKQVNDIYGHAAGDEVLRRVASTVGQQLRTAHPLFRTGGEEFAVIVPGANIDDGCKVAERVRAAVPVISVPMDGGEIRVTISIGVADSEGFATADNMLGAADAALYKAKAQGRDRVVASSHRSDRRGSAA